MASTPQFGASAVFAYNTVNTLTANTAADGTGTVTFFQTNVAGTLADWVAPADGAYIDTIIANPRGTNVATVMRVFSNAGATNATAANNQLIGPEATCPATTVSQVAALAPVIIPIKKWFPSGTKLFYTLGTAVAAGFSISVYGSNM
jgi:hypothetical protein